MPSYSAMATFSSQIPDREPESEFSLLLAELDLPGGIKVAAVVFRSKALSASVLTADEVTHPWNSEREEAALWRVQQTLLDQLVSRD